MAAISWSLDFLFARDIEQLLTIRDVERMESLSVRLRGARRGVPVVGRSRRQAWAREAR